jgi:hypothetical protein
MCGRLTTRWTRRVHSPNLFERNTIVGYTTIDSRGHVATFQTAVYPRLPTFSKVHDVPIKAALCRDLRTGHMRRKDNHL